MSNDRKRESSQQKGNVWLEIFQTIVTASLVSFGIRTFAIENN